MQITSRFTIAVHIITAIDYFQGQKVVTSNFLSNSVGANPVIIRNVMGQLKEAGIIQISQGKSGITLAKAVSDITFYEVYQAVDCVKEEGLFHFHENPNPNCPVGKNIHSAMQDKLQVIQSSMEKQMKEITLAEVERDLKKQIKQNEKTGELLR